MKGKLFFFAVTTVLALAFCISTTALCSSHHNKGEQNTGVYKKHQLSHPYETWKKQDALAQSKARAEAKVKKHEKPITKYSRKFRKTLHKVIRPHASLRHLKKATAHPRHEISKTQRKVCRKVKHGVRHARNKTNL